MKNGSGLVKQMINCSNRTLLVLIVFFSLCFPAFNVYADRQAPQTDAFNEAQKLRWAIYAYTVSQGIYEQSCILYDRINKEVNMREGIVTLATTLFSSTLSIKSLLNPNIDDFVLLTTTLGAELDFIEVISGSDVEAEIADIFVAGLATSLGSPTAFAKFCSTKTVSSIIKFYDAFQLWKLTEKVKLATALNDLMWNYYDLGGNMDQIKTYYNIPDSYCTGTYSDFDCIVKYFSQTQKVDYDKLFDDALGVLGYVNRTYTRLINLSEHIPSVPELYSPADNVNPGYINLSWSQSGCELCGKVSYNLEVHKDGIAVFKADDYLGHLINQNSFTLPEPLEPNTTYWWAVFPKSQWGVWNLDVGDWASFTTGSSGANASPVATFTLSNAVGYPSTVFSVNAGQSCNPDGNTLQYCWNWGDEDGFTIWNPSSAGSHQYQQPGNYTITLCVTDGAAESYFSRSVVVWQKNELPNKALNQRPYDASIRQPIETVIKWLNGGGATSYEIYFGTNQILTGTDLMVEANVQQFDLGQFDPGPLEYGTIYYWRIDAKNAFGKTIGDVWSFTTVPPPPWLAYHYWDFDTDDTEGWTARNANSEGVYTQEYWIIDPVSDSVSKSGIISASNLTALHTGNYDTIEVRAAVQNDFVNPLEAHLLIDGQWMSPIDLNYVSGEQTTNSQCVYRGTIPYSGRIEQVRIDFLWGSDSSEDRVFIDRVSFLQLSEPSTVTVFGYVKDENGVGIGGVTLNFSNGSGSAVTDSTGYYHNAVTEGWSGIVVPSKNLYAFQPASQTCFSLTTSQLINFTGFSPQNISSQTFYVGNGNAYDGFLFKKGFDDYAAVQGADIADAVSNPSYTTMLTVGQDRAESGEYYVFRAIIPFDTGNLPASCTITGATLYLYGYGPDYSDTDFDIHIVAGSPSAVNGLELSDYGNFGSVSGGSINSDQWQGNNGISGIPLNAAGLDLIEKEGVTIIGLRSDRDIGQQTPDVHEFVNIRSSQSGNAFRPYMVVDYITYTIDLSEVVVGTVVDQRTGLPVGDAVISINGTEVLTQSDGTYSIDVDAGQYDISCSKSGYQAITLPGVVIKPGQNQVIDFELPVSLYGTVFDALTGNTIYNVQVETDDNSSTKTNISGDYTLGNLDPGIYDITFTHQDYPPLTIENVEIVSGVSGELDAELSTPLSGTVTDLSTGLIISNATVSTNLNQSTQSDNHGHYSFASLNSGVYDLTFAKTGYQTVTIPMVIIRLDETLTLDVQLTTLGPLGITSNSLPAAETTVEYNARVRIKGGTFPYAYSLVYGMLPPGLFLDGSYGNISGMPTTSGSYTFAIGVTDLLNAYAEREFGIQVTEKLEIVSGSPLTGGTRGTAYFLSIEATGGTLPYTFSRVSGTLPSGMSLLSNGNLTGTPVSVGAYDFTVRVTDSSNRTTEKSFHLEIAEALVISTNRLNNGIVGEVFNQGLSANVGSGVYTWGVYSGILPVGLSLDSASGVLSGTPSEATYGTIVFSVSDDQGRLTYKDLTLQVCDPLQVLTSILPDALVGSSYSEAIRVTGGIPPYTFSYDGQLPEGLSLNSDTGVISGVPGSAGYVNVSITVSDSTYPTTQTVTRNLGVRTTSLLTITTSAVLPKCKKGVGMNPVVLQAGGGASPYTWSVVEGHMPSGIVLTPETSELSGIAEDRGDFIFTIKVMDSGYDTAQKEFFCHVSDDLTIATGAIPDGASGENYNFTLEGKGGLPPYTWRIKSGTLPSGMSFNGATGTISGKPTTRQIYPFTVEVSDNDTPAQTAEMTYIIKMLDELYIYTQTISNGRIDLPYSAVILASLGRPPYSWRVESGVLPPGLTLSSSPDPAIIEGTPTEVGTFVFTLKVSDTGTPVKTSLQEYTVKIYGDVVIETEGLKNANCGIPYSDTIMASGGELPYVWQITEGSLPSGLSLNSATGHISGITHLINGHSSEFTVRVSDAGNPSGFDEKELVIYVTDPLGIVTKDIQKGMQKLEYLVSLEAMAFA